MKMTTTLEQMQQLKQSFLIRGKERIASVQILFQNDFSGKELTKTLKVDT